ncbi:hypothetical protein NCS52_00508600 [Fusarium sp. LHS14.1]|nr:hypothetical protein NCS52_00508600 [Fusarium sp. LHS14.1]
MDSFPESRPQHSPASSASPQIERSKLSEAPAEGYEYNTTQSPAPDVAQYATSPSPSSMMDYASTGALNTNSASTGSAVTQLTPNDDTSTGKSYTRERVPREPKHHKNKAAHRLSALSSSGSEPHSVGHDGGFVSASQELSYFKSKSRSPQAPMLEYPSPGIPAPNEPYSQEQPYPQEASYPPEPPYSQPPVNPGWGPNYSGPAYPPYSYPPPPGQQPGLRPLSQQYPSGYGYLDPKATTLSTAFANRSSFHESQYPEAQDMMAGSRNGPGGNIDVAFADLTGYARIASAITGQVLPGVRPLYRRFEWLHHRLLLSYQDQLAELEDYLIDLDAVSTVTRRTEQGRRNLPCSEREERTEDSPYKRDKTRTMREIGHVLDAYTQLLSSLGTIQKLPAAAAEDKRAYRTFLAQRNLLVPAETEFLRAGDLVCVAREPPADAPGPANDNAEQAEGDEAAPRPEVPLRALINGFSAGFACLAVSLVALPDLTSRLIVVLCFVVLAAVVMMATGNARHLRG